MPSLWYENISNGIVAGCKINLYNFPWQGSVRLQSAGHCNSACISVSMESLLCRQFRHDRLEGRILGNVCYHLASSEAQNETKKCLSPSTLRRWGQDSLARLSPLHIKIGNNCHNQIQSQQTTSIESLPVQCPIPGWIHSKWSGSPHNGTLGEELPDLSRWMQTEWIKCGLFGCLVLRFY